MSAVMPRAAQTVGWGMTETTGSITSCGGAIYTARPDTCGSHSPLVRLVRDDDGNETPAGEAGEIWVAGALVVCELSSEPAEGSRCRISSTVRCAQGDVGMVDDMGFVRLVDRRRRRHLGRREHLLRGS
ncbi:AMP-binding protein [Sphingomonas sp. MMS24-JH45]